MLTHDYAAIRNRTAKGANKSKSVRARRNWAYDWKQAKPGPCVVTKGTKAHA